MESASTPAPPEPSVMVVMRLGNGQRSFIAFDEGGEVIETVETTEDGSPDWECGGICDPRGAGGEEGFQLLHRHLRGLEANAEKIGIDLVRLPSPS